MELNERLRATRKHFKLTQAEFGARLDVSRSVVNNWERGVVVPPGTTYKAISAEFKVNEEWLRTGEGEMFSADEKTIAASIASEYGLDETSAKIIEAFVRLPDPQRSAVKDFIINLAEAFNAGEGGKDNK